MKVLMIAHDPSLFEEGSDTQKRMTEYGRVLEGLDIVGFSDKHTKEEAYALAPNVRARATHSWSRVLWVRDAVRIGKMLPKPDLITAQDIECGLVAWKLAKHFGVPFEQQLHTDIFSKEFGITFLNRLRRHFAKKLLADAASVRVVSGRIKESLKQSGIILKQEPTILPIFVDVAKIIATEPTWTLHEKFPAFNFIILMLSRLAPEKDFHTALFAFKEVLQSDARAGLVIAGEGEERKIIEEEVARLGITNSVQLIGQEPDIVSLLKTADVLFVTSRFEGYGRVFLEAAAAGCPVVSTDVGAVREIFADGNNAFICPVGDIHCLAESLIRFINDHQKRVQMRFRAKEELRTHVAPTFEEYLARLKEGFEKCLTKV